jgi:hypothetical protein
MNFKLFTEAQRLTRGMANISPRDGWTRARAMRLIDGTATTSDILIAFKGMHLGYCWHREGEEGSEDHKGNLEDSKEYAYTESDVILKGAIDYLNDPEDEMINGSIAVVFVAEVPKSLPPNDWDSGIPSNTRLVIKEIHYNAGNGWNVIPCNIGARP